VLVGVVEVVGVVVVVGEVVGVVAAQMSSSFKFASIIRLMSTADASQAVLSLNNPPKPHPRVPCTSSTVNAGMTTPFKSSTWSVHV